MRLIADDTVDVDKNGHGGKRTACAILRATRLCES
jgi:hypothetical protein